MIELSMDDEDLIASDRTPIRNAHVVIAATVSGEILYRNDGVIVKNLQTTHRLVLL